VLPVTNASTASARQALKRVDDEMSSLRNWAYSETARAAVRPLLTAWDGLVIALGLGPEPQTRLCPVCNEPGMREATRCGYCWTKLTPLADVVVINPMPAANRGGEGMP
jgi:hypothetical protein